VIEQAGGIEENLKENHGQRHNCQNKNCCDLDSHGEKNFQGVEANSGRCIEIEIRMVHHVQAPKDGERVEHGMLNIDSKIKKHYADGYGQAIRKTALNQEPSTVALI